MTEKEEILDKLHNSNNPVKIVMFFHDEGSKVTSMFQITDEEAITEIMSRIHWNQ